MKTVGPGWREVYFVLRSVREMNAGVYPSFNAIRTTPLYLCPPTMVSFFETSTLWIMAGGMDATAVFGTGCPFTVISAFQLCGSGWYTTLMDNESLVWAKQ